MKIIVENDTGLIKYLFADDTIITIGKDKIVTPDFIIGDLDVSNATLVEGIDSLTVPADWIGNKYIRTDTDTWKDNPDYVAPEPEEATP